MRAVDNEEEFGGLALSIGINTGDVYFAPAGPDERDTVLGDAVNAAQRLQAAATAGEIFVGEETRRASDRAIAYEDVSPVQIKSTEEPIPAYRATKLATVGPEGVPAAPIVGRDGEPVVLRGVWERVTGERRAHLVTVLGPPGIGKTRLALEVARLAESAGRRRRQRTIASVRSDERLRRSASRSSRSRACTTVTRPRWPARSSWLPSAGCSRRRRGDVGRHLAALLGLGDETIPDKHVLFLSVRRFVEALAAEHPLLLVFEDIHWADASLLDLIEHLAARLRDVPLLVLALARPELLQTRPTWGGGLLTPPFRSTRSARRTHASSRFGCCARTPSTSTPSSSPASGRPPRETRSSSRSSPHRSLSRRSLARAASHDRARNHRCPPRQPGGRTPSSSMRPSSASSSGAACSSVSAAATERSMRFSTARGPRDLVRREPTSRLEGDEEYSFKHMLIREVAYGTLPKAVRRERHAVVATQIEEFVGERIGASASILAHHWEQAGELDKAVEYMISAARVAGRVGEGGGGRALLASARSHSGRRPATPPVAPRARDDARAGGRVPPGAPRARRAHPRARRS